ncbi:MAG: twin-arginine translocation signal domain-containing protein, partial [Phycisphaerae bacterium]|nr:twin-arginine translocation signal domain-containing protein [Phycisphaerae bacterium]
MASRNTATPDRREFIRTAAAGLGALAAGVAAPRLAGG